MGGKKLLMIIAVIAVASFAGPFFLTRWLGISAEPTLPAKKAPKDQTQAPTLAKTELLAPKERQLEELIKEVRKKLELYDLALLDFESALELEPESITSLVNIAHIFSLEKDTYLACSFLEKAVVMGLDDLIPLYTEPAFSPLMSSGCIEDLEKRIKGH